MQGDHSVPPSFQYLQKLLAVGPVQGGGAAPLSYHVLQLLLEFQNESLFAGDLVEIGVWRGDTFALLATASLDDQHVIAIDIGEHWLKESSSLAESACREYGLHPLICPLQGSSTHPYMKGLLKEALGIQGIRFAHIDGEHSRELALSDARLVSNLMAPWGLICFDDCLALTCPGVAQAFFEFAAESEWTPLLFTPNKSYLCHKRYTRVYRRYILGIVELLERTRSTIASVSSSSCYPDEGFISIFSTARRFYQVVNMQYSTYEEFVRHEPNKLDIMSCSALQ
jgi:hypothetical protein